jgi:hypothetical protein
VVAAIHGISVFLVVIGSIALAGWVLDQVVNDVRGIRRGRRRRR